MVYTCSCIEQNGIGFRVNADNKQLQRKLVGISTFLTQFLFNQKIVMNTCPKMDPDGGCDPFLTVQENGKVRLFSLNVCHACLHLLF